MKSSVEQLVEQPRLLQAWREWNSAWLRSRQGNALLYLLRGCRNERNTLLDALEGEVTSRGWSLLRIRQAEKDMPGRSFTWTRYLLDSLLPLLQNSMPNLLQKYKYVLYPLLRSRWSEIYGTEPEDQITGWLLPRAPSPLDLRVSAADESCLRIANGVALLWRDVAHTLLMQSTPLTVILDQADRVDRWSLTVLKRFIQLSSKHQLAVIMGSSLSCQNIRPFNVDRMEESETLQVRLWQRFCQKLPVQREDLCQGDEACRELPDLSHRCLEAQMTGEHVHELLNWNDAVGLLHVAACEAERAQNRAAKAEATFLAARAWLLERCYEEALERLVQAYQQASDPVFRATCAIYAGVICANYRRDSDAAQRWAQDGLAVLGNQQDEAAQRVQGWLFNVSALAFYRQRKFPEAGQCLKKALQIAQNLQEGGGAYLGAAIASNLNLLYEAMGEFAKALALHNKFAPALDRADPLAAREFWHRQACLMWRLGRQAEADEAWEKAYALTQRYHDDYLSELIARAAACSWSQVEGWSRACTWAERSLHHSRQTGYTEGEVRNRLALALLYQRGGQGEQARVAVQQAKSKSALLAAGMDQTQPLWTRLLAAWETQEPTGDAALLQELFPRPSTRFSYPFHVFDL